MIFLFYLKNKGRFPAETAFYPKIEFYVFSLRWYYPDQVQRVYSQAYKPPQIAIFLILKIKKNRSCCQVESCCVVNLLWKKEKLPKRHLQTDLKTDKH